MPVDKINRYRLARRWKLSERVCRHRVSYRCGDSIPRGGSVCSLRDPWPLRWERGRPVQISSETRPQGVLQCVSGASWNYICLLHGFSVCLLFCRETERSEIETNAKQRGQKGDTPCYNSESGCVEDSSLLSPTISRLLDLFHCTCELGPVSDGGMQANR